MSNHRELLGECPVCGESIGPGSRLISYEDERGTPKSYASCPGCQEVVQPR